MDNLPGRPLRANVTEALLGSGGPEDGGEALLVGVGNNFYRLLRPQNGRTPYVATTTCGSFRPLRIERRCSFEDLAEPLDRSAQLYPRLHFHFVHHLGAM